MYPCVPLVTIHVVRSEALITQGRGSEEGGKERWKCTLYIYIHVEGREGERYMYIYMYSVYVDVHVK